MKSLSLNQPHLLVTVGIPGSGKSFFAERFAATFNAPYVKYDTILAVAEGNSTISDMYAGYMLRELFKTGHTVMFDGPSASRAERDALKNLAASAGYACLFIWTQTDEATAKARFVKASRKNGHHAVGAHYEALMQEFSPPVAKEHPTVVVSGKHTYATQAKAVLKTLALGKQIARTTKAHSHSSSTPVVVAVNAKRNRNITIQ